MNKDGNYLTTKQADIGAAATVALAPGSNLIPADPSADFSGVNLYDMSGPDTWPITMISYFYLEKDLSGMDAQTAALVVAFIKFVLSAEGQEKAEEKLFVKLPTEMQTYNTATLDSLTLPAGYAALSVELGSDTLIEVGAGMNVLSGKRRDYGEWDRDRMEAQIEKQASVEMVQALLTAHAGACAAACGWRDRTLRIGAFAEEVCIALARTAPLYPVLVVAARRGHADAVHALLDAGERSCRDEAQRLTCLLDRLSFVEPHAELQPQRLQLYVRAAPAPLMRVHSGLGFSLRAARGMGSHLYRLCACCRGQLGTV